MRSFLHPELVVRARPQDPDPDALEGLRSQERLLSQLDTRHPWEQQWGRPLGGLGTRFWRVDGAILPLVGMGLEFRRSGRTTDSRSGSRATKRHCSGVLTR